METLKLPLVFLLFTFLFAASSCVDDIFIEGNGHRESEFRKASGFEEVASSGDFNVYVNYGTAYSVEVSAESNLLSYIETDIVGNTLKIRTRGLHSLRQNYPIEIYITTPVLDGLSLSGSGLIETDSFVSNYFTASVSGSGDIDAKISADKIKASVSGSGTIFLDGDAGETEFVVSGSGKIKSYNLWQVDCKAVISGSGDMFVNPSETLDARISGSGRVYYINNPIVHTSISGSGKVVDNN